MGVRANVQAGLVRLHEEICHIKAQHASLVNSVSRELETWCANNLVAPRHEFYSAQLRLAHHKMKADSARSSIDNGALQVPMNAVPRTASGKGASDESCKVC